MSSIEIGLKNRWKKYLLKEIKHNDLMSEKYKKTLSKEIAKKKKSKHDKIVLLRKTKLRAIEILISKALIDSYISHDEFVLVNKVLREYNKMKEEIKNPDTSMKYDI